MKLDKWTFFFLFLIYSGNLRSQQSEQRSYSCGYYGTRLTLTFSQNGQQSLANASVDGETPTSLMLYREPKDGSKIYGSTVYTLTQYPDRLYLTDDRRRTPRQLCEELPLSSGSEQPHVVLPAGILSYTCGYSDNPSKYFQIELHQIGGKHTANLTIAGHRGWNPVPATSATMQQTSKEPYTYSDDHFEYSAHTDLFAELVDKSSGEKFSCWRRKDVDANNARETANEQRLRSGLLAEEVYKDGLSESIGVVIVETADRQFKIILKPSVVYCTSSASHKPDPDCTAAPTLRMDMKVSPWPVSSGNGLSTSMYYVARLTVETPSGALPSQQADLHEEDSATFNLPVYSLSEETLRAISIGDRARLKLTFEGLGKPAKPTKTLSLAVTPRIAHAFALIATKYDALRASPASGEGRRDPSTATCSPTRH